MSALRDATGRRRARLITATAIALVVAPSCSGDDDISLVVIGDSAPTTESTTPASTAPPTTLAPTTTSTIAAPTTTTTTTTTTIAPTTTTTTTLTPTTTTIAPTTTLAPTTTTIAPTTTLAATTTTIPPTTTTTEPEPTGTPTDVSLTQWVVGPHPADPEVSTDASQCGDFYGAITASWGECGEWQAFGGRRMWTVTKSANDRFLGLVWQEIAPDTWTPLLRLVEPAPGTWDSVVVKTDDIDSGPNDELVAGIRWSGSGGDLDIDVIDIRGGDPTVVGHVSSIPQGVAFTDAQLGVWLWFGDYTAGDPPCCPSLYSQYLLASEGGTWTISEGMAGMPPSVIPQTSDF